MSPRSLRAPPMSLSQRATSILISVLLTTVSAFVMMGLSGGYMAWPFAMIAALIAAPVSAASTLVWHLVGTLCIASVLPVSGVRSRTWRRVALTGITAVVATSVLTGLLLGLRPGLDVAFVAAPLSLGGVAYVLMYLWFAADNAPSRFAKPSRRGRAT